MTGEYESMAGHWTDPGRYESTPPTSRGHEVRLTLFWIAVVLLGAVLITSGLVMLLDVLPTNECGLP